MKPLLLRIVVPAVVVLGSLAPSAWARDVVVPLRKFNLPPSVDLSYSIKARQSGLSLTGDAQMKWELAGNKFHIITETRAMIVGKILDANSVGTIDNYGLAPTQFTEKRFRKDATTTTFHRDSNIISFTASEGSYQIRGGEQDRTSITWQLVAVARGAPDKFKPGSKWTFFVAGQRDAEPWTFTVLQPEAIRTPLGDLRTIHVSRAPPPGSSEQRLDLWLAPSLEWYPVRLRFADADGDYVEQLIDSANKK